MTILRGRITDAGTIELLDPIPDDFDRSQEVQVLISEKPKVYETVNEYGDRVIVDEENGLTSPVEPMNLKEFMDAVGGIWSDRQAEITDSVEWIKEQRRKEEERSDPWRGRTLS